jgi:pyruvate formate lyase activating enzyme
MGFLVKIDTNGSKPDTLKYLLDHLLIDYVSLDFKALPYKFYEITRSDFYDHFVSSLSILQNAIIDFEVRTTIHSSLFTKTDLESMIEILSGLGYQGKYFLQYFRPGMGTLGDIGDSSFEPNLQEINDKGLEIIFR